MTARVLLLDIETAPILGAVWKIWKENIGLEQIEGDWYILSFCAKWLGSKRSEVIYHDSASNPNREDDTELLKKLWTLLDQADVVVAHNGRRFDVRKINTRLVTRCFAPPSPFVIVDTLEIAKRHFSFTSNKLQYLSDRLCASKKRLHGQFPGYLLWKECLRGNPKAWAEMRRYNIQDVISLEELYLKLRPWMVGHPNLGNFGGDTSATTCPKCGSTHIHKRGSYYTQVGVYQRYRCTTCGGWSRGRKQIGSRKHRDNLLVN